MRNRGTMKSPIFQKTDGGKLEIGLSALLKMLKFRQNTCWKREAGGVLIGRYIRDSLDVVVDDVTVPMRGDVRRRCSFFRNRNRHQRAIDQAWRESDGTSHYLGEWHTHPEETPTASPTDQIDWQQHLQQDIFSGDSLFFIIVGTNCLRVWEWYTRNTNSTLIGEAQYKEGKRRKIF